MLNPFFNNLFYSKDGIVKEKFVEETYCNLFKQINPDLIIEKKKLIFPKEKHYVILAGIVVLYMLLRNIPIFDFLLPIDV